MITLKNKIKLQAGTSTEHDSTCRRISVRDKLLVKEVQEMEENLPQSCKVQFDDPSVLHHFVLFITPDEGHWSGGVFKFDVKIPDDYNILDLLNFDDPLNMEAAEHYARSKASGNKVSRQSVLCGSQNIVINGKDLLNFDDPLNMEAAEHYARSKASGNKVSRQSVLCGSQNIVINGKTIIMTNSVIRGDLANIRIGRFCVVSKGAVIRPAFKKFNKGAAFFPLHIGDHVFVGNDSIVKASQVGSYVHIGKNCIIGHMSILKDCCAIADNTVLPPDTVVPPFTIFDGSPEAGFSPMNALLTKQRNRLDVGVRGDLRMKLTDLQPNVHELIKRHQLHPSQ